MKHLVAVLIFWFSFEPILFGSSKIHDLSATDVPILGKLSSGTSEDKMGNKLSITYGSNGTTVVYSNKNLFTSSINFSKGISIYSIRWHDQSPWFVVRDGRNIGNPIICIVEFRPSDANEKFAFYTPNVVDNNSEGFIFDILDINQKTISVTVSIRDGNSTKGIYKKGIINKSDLEKLTKEKMTLVVDGVSESAGINRLETENERVLQRKSSQ